MNPDLIVVFVDGTEARVDSLDFHRQDHQQLVLEVLEVSELILTGQRDGLKDWALHIPGWVPRVPATQIASIQITMGA